MLSVQLVILINSGQISRGCNRNINNKMLKCSTYKPSEQN